ncbi:hypothetical protein EAD96_09180 [Micromonospora sp. BL1]|nr:hypothetical protein EAD96_09180 [Micromonospora sp. BL1]
MVGAQDKRSVDAPATLRVPHQPFVVAPLRQYAEVAASHRPGPHHLPDLKSIKHGGELPRRAQFA